MLPLGIRTYVHAFICCYRASASVKRAGTIGEDTDDQRLLVHQHLVSHLLENKSRTTIGASNNREKRGFHRAEWIVHSTPPWVIDRLPHIDRGF